MSFHSAVSEGTVLAPGVEILEDGSARAPAGMTGCLVFGPYLKAEAGVYSVTISAEVQDGAPSPLYWDVYADGRVYGWAEFTHGSRLIVRVPDTESLEFRLTTRGAGFVHRGVELEPLLLDRDPVAPDQVDAIIQVARTEWANPEPFFHLVERLARSGRPEAAENWRKLYLGGEHREYPTLRAAFLELHTPGLTTISPEFDLGLSHGEVTDIMAHQPLEFIALQPLSFQQQNPADEVRLRDRGYQPDFIQATRLHRSYRRPRRPWQEPPEPGAPFKVPAQQTSALSNVDLSFQDDVASGEGMTAYCPVSGKMLKSHHAFCHHVIGLPQTMYRFEGVEVFYVCTGNYPNSRLFMFMPQSGTVVIFEEPQLRWYPYHDLVREFVANLVYYRSDVRAYLNGPTRPAAVLGLNNIAHFFWNDLAGLQHAFDKGLVDDLAAVVTVPIQYIDHLALFPELASKLNTYIQNPRDVFAHFVRERYLPVRFTDAIITPEFFRRIRRAADERASPAGSPPPDAPRPLLWLNLRFANKMWTDQVQGYANILNAVREEYGGAAALLQGMPDTREMAAEIRGLTHPDIPLFDGIEIDIYDKLSWAGKVDAYISVVGAGLAFTTWFADVPGVGHAEHGHLEHLLWWPDARPEAIPTLAPSKAEVRELGEGWYCNYELDWRRILELLRQALAQAGIAPRS